MNRTLVQQLTYGLLLRGSREQLLFGTTKLVKLIYLVDCEYYRWQRRTATETEWVFYHYGPYSAELIEAINRTPGVLVESEIELDDGRSFRGYKLKSFGNDPISTMHFSVRGPVEAIYKRWAGSDLSLLLDHVYYETAPMLSAIRHQPLDFSLIPDPKQSEISSAVRDFSALIPNQQRQALQQRLKESAASYRVHRRPLALELNEKDEEALQAMGDRD